MSGFSADWLALREAADLAARNADLVARCGAFLDGRHGAICDLGSGTGAAVRAFAPVFPAGARWLLVDNDAGNLAEATRRLAGVARTDVLVHDLAADPAPWPVDCALVTATALFDLAAPAWIERLAEALARDGLPILATLSYDGRMIVSPPHPADAAMIEAFNRHQRLDKGLGGPAAGPTGAEVLATALARRGYRVETAPSPWRLGAADRDLWAATLAGWAGAVADAGFMARADVETWLAARLERTDSLIVGHTDIFARPKDEDQ